MTYGWAILVVLVAVGALAYFGVLNPDRFLPSKCTLQSGIACVDHKVEFTAGTGGVGLVTVRLTNSIGYDIDTINVRVGDCGNSVSNCFLPPCATTLANGASYTYQINCGATLSGSKYSKQLNITYRNVDTLISHNNPGQLIARIE